MEIFEIFVVVLSLVSKTFFYKNGNYILHFITYKVYNKISTIECFMPQNILCCISIMVNVKIKCNRLIHI